MTEKGEEMGRGGRREREKERESVLSIEIRIYGGGGRGEIIIPLGSPVQTSRPTASHFL